MKIHELKLDIKYFDEVKNGNKCFEIRKNDRDYQIGDVLELKAYKNYKNDKKSHYIRHENDSVLKTYNPDRADTIKVKVTLVITAEKYNEKCDFTDPTILENELDYKFGVRGTQKVLKEYFGTERLLNDYVLLKTEVIE